MAFDIKKFGMRLKQLREENNMTQDELGEKLGITRNTISGYEGGNRKPDIEKLIELSNIFECTIDYMAGKTNNKKPKHAVAIYKNELSDINVDDLDKIKELIRKLQQQDID